MLNTLNFQYGALDVPFKKKLPILGNLLKSLSYTKVLVTLMRAQKL